MSQANKLVSAKRPFSHYTNKESTVEIEKQELPKKTNLSRRTLVKGKKSSLALNKSKKGDYHDDDDKGERVQMSPIKAGYNF